MTKDGGGKDSGGKIMKGPNFTPPEILEVLKNQGMKTITIHCVPNDLNNQLAYELMSVLPNVMVEGVICPSSIKDIYHVPFIEDEMGSRHFGIAGIDRFVKKR